MTPTPSPRSGSLPEGESPRGLAWLRWYTSADHWKPFGPDDDYRIFGDMWLSDLRAARDEHDALIALAVNTLEKYAVHAGGCGWHRGVPSGCDCGLAKVETALRETADAR